MRAFNVLLPFEYLLKSVFNLSYRLTSNYGLSLILLSLVVTAITTPFYFLADRWKAQEKAIQSTMKADLDSINANFTKQKKFYLTQACYRIHNYKLWYPLRTSFGLLVQIPFFFAAYNVLSSFKGYEGVPFLFIKNLGRPDALLFSINILPFIMTAVNLLSACVYARNFRFTENAQTAVLATVFFLLLYDSPSAMLVYWTCNNILSLLKNIFVVLKERKTWESQATRTHTDSGKLSAGGWKSMVAGVIAVYSGLVVYEMLGFHAAGVYLAFFSVGCAVRIAVCCLKQRNVIPTALFFFVAHLICAGICFCKRSSSIRDYEIFLCLAFIFSPLAVASCSSSVEKPFGLKDKLAVNFLFSGMFAFVLPFTFFFANIVDFRNSIVSVFIFLLVHATFVFLSICILSFTIFRKSNSLQVGLLFIFLLYAFNALLLPLNAGFLSGFSFKNDEVIIHPERYLYLKDIIVLSFCGYIVNYLLRKKKNLVVPILAVCFAAACFTMVREFLGSWNAPRGVSKPISRELPEDYDKIHTFSKNNHNVIFVMADMMNGNYVGEALEHNPGLARVFSGFTWYKDTLSISGETVFSMPALYGGEEFGPIQMNKTSNTYIEDAKDAIDRFWIPFLEKGFKTSNVYEWGALNLSVSGLDKISHIPDIEYYEQNCAHYIGPWAYRNGINADFGDSSRLLIKMLPIYKAAPNIIKKYLYNYGIWNSSKTLFRERQEMAAKGLAHLELMPEISSVQVTDRDNFLFILSAITHDPYGFTSDGNLVQEPDNLIDPELPFYAAKTFLNTFAKFIQWLKDNEIYDNTMIIICSDHGNAYYDNELVRMFPDADQRTKYDLSKAYATLMVKQFSSPNENLNIDSVSQLQNSDVYGLLQEYVFGNGSAFSDAKNNIGRKRTYSDCLEPTNDYRQKKHFKFADYEVEGSIFEKSSWRKIDGEME